MSHLLILSINAPAAPMIGSLKIIKYAQLGILIFQRCEEFLSDLSTVSITETGETQIIPKRKTLQYSFCEPVVEWIKIFDELTRDRKSWFFPPLQVVFDYAEFDFNRIRINKRTGEPYPTGMSIQNYDRILQKLDPKMTSSMFRYGHTERLLLLGYTPYELRQVGDWSSSLMPELYAQRKDLGPAQRKFAEDIR